VGLGSSSPHTVAHLTLGGCNYTEPPAPDSSLSRLAGPRSNLTHRVGLVAKPFRWHDRTVTVVLTICDFPVTTSPPSKPKRPRLAAFPTVLCVAKRGWLTRTWLTRNVTGRTRVKYCLPEFDERIAGSLAEQLLDCCISLLFAPLHSYSKDTCARRR
jgi:hypothetical protein